MPVVPRSIALPDDLEGMHPRQRELLRVIYASGGATVREVHRRIPHPPSSICGVRTLLNRLVRKGFLRSRRSGRHSEVIYLPAHQDPDVWLRAFDRLARDHFGGSRTRAIASLSRLAAETNVGDNNKIATK
jgi:predicted transcriptional regulator